MTSFTTTTTNGKKRQHESNKMRSSPVKKESARSTINKWMIMCTHILQWRKLYYHDKVHVTGKITHICNNMWASQSYRINKILFYRLNNANSKQKPRKACTSHLCLFCMTATCKANWKGLAIRKLLLLLTHTNHILNPNNPLAPEAKDIKNTGIARIPIHVQKNPVHGKLDQFVQLQFKNKETDGNRQHR